MRTPLSEELGVDLALFAFNYQPDVVMLPAGAEAIRSVSPDGLIWTIDPDSRDAEDIRPGKVLLLTSRAYDPGLREPTSKRGLLAGMGPMNRPELRTAQLPVLDSAAAAMPPA